jgi:hypothetical protein
MTEAPSAANLIAIAAPIPFDDPVTTATLLASFILALSLSSAYSHQSAPRSTTEASKHLAIMECNHTPKMERVDFSGAYS